jgi:type II secretory pathway component PulK
MRTWTRGLALALVLGVVVTLAVAAPAMLEERLAHVEGRLEELSRRISDLQWMVGLGVGWLTAVVAAAVGVLLKYR